MSRIRPFLPLFLTFLGIVTLLLLGTGSWLIARKVIAFLVLPCGAIWLALLGLVFWPGITRWKRGAFFSVWILYSLAGSPYVGIALLRTLEQPYYSAEILDQKLDALVLLGGGTVASPLGRPALGTHGDRILRPASYFHEGLVGKLITTGRSVTERGEDRLLSRETSEIWQGLGIPPDAIIEVPEPRNTAEEMEALSALMGQHPEWENVGLCSSASHLNRALSEAEKRGLHLIPVPSDFRSVGLPFSPLYLVPQGRGFRDVQTALWEYLGAMF